MRHQNVDSNQGFSDTCYLVLAKLHDTSESPEVTFLTELKAQISIHTVYLEDDPEKHW